jgi:hypothetical protein
MIRYSSYGRTNYRTPSAAQVIYLDPLEAQYRELLDLRERVREAEAAAELKRFEARCCIPSSCSCAAVLTLPTSKMPFRMAFLIAEKYGLPKHWTKKQIAWGRKQFEATMTDLERECEAAGIIP